MNKKPVILIICGKSASGKNITARWLYNNLIGMNIKTHIAVSDTTRPKRVGEQDNIDYHFLSEQDFRTNIRKKEYLEYSCFRNWYYGVHKTEIQDDQINIVILNPQGLEAFKKYRRKYNIIPIYLDDRLTDRLLRSHDREGCWRIEYFRRAFVDWISFSKIKKLLDSFEYSIVLTNENGAVRKVRQILFQLQDFKII